MNNQDRFALSALCWPGHHGAAHPLDEDALLRLERAGLAERDAHGLWHPTVAGRFAAAAGRVADADRSAQD